MIRSFRGAAAAIAVLACVGCAPTADRAKATISYIDRTCDIVETTDDGATHRP